MAVESTGNERGNPRLFELIENSPKTGDSPTIWAWPQITEFLKVASQPVQGPWPAHQEATSKPRCRFNASCSKRQEEQVTVKLN